MLPFAMLVQFHAIADRIFLRLLQAPSSWMACPSNLIVPPEPGLKGLYASRNIVPLVVSLKPDIQESLFLQALGPVGFYYGLAYRWFDLGEWVCFFFISGVYCLLGMLFL